MRKSFRLLIAGFAIVSFSPVYAACEYPQEISIPDGATATNEDMLAGQALVKQYMAEMEAYLDCLDKDEANDPEKQSPEAKALHVQRHNTAVDAMESVAAKFNEQIRAYKQVN